MTRSNHFSRHFGNLYAHSLGFLFAMTDYPFQSQQLQKSVCTHYQNRSHVSTQLKCVSPEKLMKITFTGEKGRKVRRRISRPAALQTATTVAALKCIEVEYWLHQHHKSSILVPENNATKQTKSFLLSYCMLLILSCFGDAQSTGCRDIFSQNRIETAV